MMYPRATPAGGSLLAIAVLLLPLLARGFLHPQQPGSLASLVRHRSTVAPPSMMAGFGGGAAKPSGKGKKKGSSGGGMGGGGAAAAEKPSGIGKGQAPLEKQWDNFVALKDAGEADIHDVFVRVEGDEAEGPWRKLGRVAATGGVDANAAVSAQFSLLAWCVRVGGRNNYDRYVTPRRQAPFLQTPATALEDTDPCTLGSELRQSPSRASTTTRVGSSRHLPFLTPRSSRSPVMPLSRTTDPRRSLARSPPAGRRPRSSASRSPARAARAA